MNTKNYIKIAVGIALTVVLVWILSKQAKLSEVLTLLKGLPISVLLISFALYMCGHVLRAVRFYQLLEWKGSFHEMFSIVCLHMLFVNTMPARTGEVSYLYMTKKRDVPLTKGAPVLILVSLLDIVAVALILFVSILFAGSLSPALSKISYWVAGLLLLILIVTFSLGAFSGPMLGALHKFFSRLGFGGKKAVKWMFEKGEEVSKSFKMLNSPKVFAVNLAYSLLIWVFRFAFFYLITRALGVSIGLWACIIGITLPIVSTFLPLQGIGGFGTLEGVWTLAFVALGVSKEAAVLSGFGFHIVFLVFTAVAGLYGFIALWLISRNNKNQAILQV